MAITATSSYNSELLVGNDWTSPLLVRRRISPSGHSRGSDSSLDSAITRSSLDSSSSSSSFSPSYPFNKQSVGATLNEYVAASNDGRDAFSHGNLKGAVLDFNHALALELKTELDCLYDTSIGLMSGLVRSEVNSRLLQVHKCKQGSAKCSRILRQLRENFYNAAEGVERKHTEPKWYLQMGASLVMINEWEKAKTVYSEGISVCRDRKKLKHALKNLIKIEQMTSYADIPVEDQPCNHSPAPSSPLPSPISSSPLHSPRPSPSPRLTTSPRPTMSPRPTTSPQPPRSPRPSLAASLPRITPITNSPRRDRSKSVATKLRKQARERTTSFSMEHKMKEDDLRRKSEAAVPRIVVKSHLHKRSSFGIFTSKRVTLLSPDTTSAWSNCFEPSSCKVTSQTEFQPSAITHMRTLSSLDYDDDVPVSKSGVLSEPFNCSGKFSAVTFTSLRIEDDDSELDDSD